MRCMLEFSRKRDLGYRLAAAHLNHRLRGKSAVRDQTFCRNLCSKQKVEFIEALCDTKKLARHLKRSKEDEVEREEPE